MIWLRASLIACLLSTSLAAAAEVVLPARNPKAKVVQQVGLTEIAVEYNRLAVRGRAIWGGAVPYGRVWTQAERAGLKVSFSRDVVVGDQKVPAGQYALLLLPSEKDWTLILNRDLQVAESGRGYRADLDVARVEVAAQPEANRERLTVAFSDFTDEQASLDLAWEKRRVSLPIKVNTSEQILADISTLDYAWRRFADLGRYLLQRGSASDVDAALRYADQSLALRETRTGDWVKASALAAKARFADARDWAERAAQTPLGPDDSWMSELEISRAAAEWGRLADRGGPRPKLPPAGTSKAPLAKGSVAPPSPTMEPPPFTTAEPLPASERASLTVPVLPVAADSGRRPQPIAESPHNIGTVVDRGKADVQACYQRALRRGPVPTDARVTLSIGVNTSGLVKSVVLTSPATLKSLEPCVKEAVSRWLFPASPHEYGAEIPIVLEGKDKE